METLTEERLPQNEDERMDGSADKLVRDVRIVVEDAEDLIKATAGDIQEKTREARAKLAGALVVAKESLNRAEDTATHGAQLADTWIRQYPYQSAAVAFVAGVLVGALVTRR
jgi:ElaB/YqjD/DUF883 family membrane-anchored ribosome-binding protein